MLDIDVALAGSVQRRSVKLAVVALAALSFLTHVDALRASEGVPSTQDATGTTGPTERQVSHNAADDSRLQGPPADHRESELRCLALNIYFEARGEPVSGQRAVAHVVMNRLAHPKYPDSVCQVVQQGGEERLHRCQFSWWCDGHSDKPVDRKAWNKALELARKVYLGDLQDTTGGALWYHATYVKPYWSDLLLKGDKIGQHVFYLENRSTSETL